MDLSNPSTVGNPEGRDPSRSGLPISGGLLAILVASAFLLLREGELQPSRPRFEETVRVHDLETEDVRARLWQDPFAAVARHQREPDHRDRSHYLAVRPIQGPAATAEATDLQVLGVMVFGGPYDEQAERRLRSRYAVLSALSELRYEPEDSEHIGYFAHRWSGNLDHRAAEVVVPYEWFRSAERRLLVLWLDDDAFRPRPLARLAELIEKVRETASPAAPAGLDVTLLGPNGSTNLRAMADELQGCRSEPDRRCGEAGQRLAGVRIYSPSATIAKEPLGVDGETLDDRFRAWTGSQESRLLRTIGSDRTLGRALVEELQRRWVDPVCEEGAAVAECNRRGSEGPHHVALVSEWDTHYGRALPCAFAASALGGLYPPSCAEGSARRADAEPGWIHRFSYLRGFDGQVPEMRQDPEPGGAASAEPERRPSAAVERPVGPRRLDYVRRLGGQLERLDDRLRASFGSSSGLKAIGVLGSDVYDKLLILQALRDRFPHVIFFTTDLDASLLHPAEYGATRNLVVASNFGLELHRERQGSTPAFRDNYQTSVFFGTRVALQADLRQTLGDQQTLDDWLAAPRIFEIGRKGAFDLSPPAETGPEPILHPERTDHLARERPPWYRKILALAGALSVLFMVLYWRFYREDDRTRLTGTGTLRGLCALLLAAGWSTLAWHIVRQGPDGEPFALLDGISVWPSLLLRYLVAVLALYFIVSSWKRMKESDEALVRRYLPGRATRLVERSGQRTGLRGLARLARGRLDRALRSSPQETLGFAAVPLARVVSGETGLLPTSEPPPVAAEELLRDHLRRGRLSRRLLRVLPLSAVYFVFCFMVIALWGRPNTPGRGGASFVSTLVVTLGLAVPLLIVLTFWVVDATKLSVRLTRRLAECRTYWPKEILSDLAERLHLHPAILGEWLDIRVIARHSVAVGRLVYAPVAVIVLMIASRASLFDHWDFPVGLCVVISVTVLYAILCAFSLRRAAEQARSEAERHYRIALLKAAGGGDDRLADQIRLILAEIKNLRLGAFVPFSQQPWVRAVALLFGGGGSLVLLEYLLWLS